MLDKRSPMYVCVSTYKLIDSKSKRIPSTYSQYSCSAFYLHTCTLYCIILINSYNSLIHLNSRPQQSNLMLLFIYIIIIIIFSVTGYSNDLLINFDRIFFKEDIYFCPVRIAYVLEVIQK